MVTQPDPDLAGMVEDLILVNWNEENCTKPVIDQIQNVKRINLKSQNCLLVYDSGLDESQGDVQMDSLDYDGSVHIDIRSMISKDEALAVRAETRRILLNLRRDPGSGWHRIASIHTTNLTNKSVGLWRYVLDIKFIARKKVI